MKRYISFWLLGLLWFSFQVCATEIAHIKEVLEYITDNDTLVVFDIDNTLLHPETDLGSDQWFSHLVQEQCNAGLEENTAIEKVLPLYFHVHYAKDLVPTEASISQDVKQIQKRCDHVICLTARSIPLVERTLEQLAKNNLNFHISEIQDYVFNSTIPSVYKQGVIFCGNNDKGKMLFRFLDTNNYQPKRIIFVDDKEKNIHTVVCAAQEKNIPCIGLRYCGCDERVAAFDDKQTQKEMEYFLMQYPLKEIFISDLMKHKQDYLLF